MALIPTSKNILSHLLLTHKVPVPLFAGNVLTDHLDFEEVRGFVGMKESTVKANGTEVNVAVISGLHNAEPIIENIIKGVDVGYDLIEVMACPGGCICGAGHPIPEKIDTLYHRQQVLINIDKTSKYRKSQENPDILMLYQDFYGEANSELAHKLLHTHYRPAKGSSLGTKGRKMANSAFMTHELTVCTCDACSAQGSQDLFNTINENLKRLKMDAFVHLNTIRLKETHPSAGESIYITLDGNPIEPSIQNICRLIRKSQ